MAAMARRFPQGLRYSIPYDTTIFVQDSITEVYKTLYQAGILVLIVILVFLQNFRATLVPATTVPVTIIGAFAGDGGARLHRQPVDPVRHRAGDRHRGRRRHRHRRGRLEVYRAGHVRPRRRDQGDGRTVRTGRRHHAGADGGVPAGRLRARPDRQDVRPVRAGHRGDGADQRDQRGDAEADAVRPVAAHSGAAGAAQLLLSRLQRRLRPDGARLRGVHRPHGAPQRPHGADRAGAAGRRHLGHRAAADRVHPDRRPGLSDDRRCSCRTAPSLGRTTAALEQAAKAAREIPGVAAGDRALRDLGARQQRRPRQRGHRLGDAQAVRRAPEGQGPGPADDLPAPAEGGRHAA